MTKLLVSVRSAREARAALNGGADIIDVKEPYNGSLGRARDSVIQSVIEAVAGKKTVSAAMGELNDYNGVLPPHGLAFVKWGLAGLQDADWKTRFNRAAADLPKKVRSVVVAYADAELADVPSVQDVVQYACERTSGVMLIDTFCKNGKNLFDWLSAKKLHKTIQQCHAAGVRIALAGSLSFDHVPIIAELQPDWMAVRGAVCDGRQRDSDVSEDRIRQFVDMLQGRMIA